MLDIANPKRKRKSLKWILIDSFIIGCIAFLAVLPTEKLPSVFDLYVACKAFITAFILQLAVERGLKPALGK